MNRVILKYEFGYNHLQPSTTIHNHPQPPKKPSKITQKHQQRSTAQKLPKKAKTCHIQLFYYTLDVNTDTDVDFDSDLKQWYLYMCVCVYYFFVGLIVCFCQNSK